MNLYRLENGIGTYWVVAPDPNAAQLNLESVLKDGDYGFSKDRETQSIHLIAKEITDAKWLTGKTLLLPDQK